ncbi:MAG: hypothetical protein IPH55_17125 [Betaproteobacteria bacterium]|nr:hypothetical protein [Betaproteobacteria bacterium]
MVFAATATALALVASVVNVSLHWGGTSGAVLPALAGVAVLLAAVWASRSAVATALTGWREQLWLVAAAAMLGAGVSVLVGGAYLGERFATTREDLDGRMKHWSASLDMLAWPADWVFGRAGTLPGVVLLPRTGYRAAGQLRLEAGKRQRLSVAVGAADRNSPAARGMHRGWRSSRLPWRAAAAMPSSTT